MNRRTLRFATWKTTTKRKTGKQQHKTKQAKDETNTNNKRQAIKGTGNIHIILSPLAHFSLLNK